MIRRGALLPTKMGKIARKISEFPLINLIPKKSEYFKNNVQMQPLYTCSAYQHRGVSEFSLINFTSKTIFDLTKMLILCKNSKYAASI